MALAAGLEILDPTAERDEAPSRPLAPRGPVGRIALLDISKPRGDVFFAELEALLVARGYEVERAAKPTFTKPAPADLRRRVAESCDAVIEALAD